MSTGIQNDLCWPHANYFPCAECGEEPPTYEDRLADTSVTFTLAEVVGVLDEVRRGNTEWYAYNYGAIRDSTCESVEFLMNILFNTKRDQA